MRTNGRGLELRWALFKNTTSLLDLLKDFPTFQLAMWFLQNTVDASESIDVDHKLGLLMDREVSQFPYYFQHKITCMIAHYKYLQASSSLCQWKETWSLGGKVYITHAHIRIY